jgi:hypothetical protein
MTITDPRTAVLDVIDAEIATLRTELDEFTSHAADTAPGSREWTMAQGLITDRIGAIFGATRVKIALIREGMA